MRAAALVPRLLPSRRTVAFKMSDQLRAMFPDADQESLEAVLAMHNNDVGASTNFLLGEDAGAAGNNGGNAAVPNDDDGAADPDGDAGEEDGEEEEDDDGDGEEDDDEQEPVVPAPKRARTVEASDPAKQQGSPAFWAQFDATTLRKTYLELVNLNPSKLAHTCTYARLQPWMPDGC